MNRYQPFKELEETLQKVRPFTMVNEASLRDLAHQVWGLLSSNTPGSFVECGAWRGGASFLMADLLRKSDSSGRKVWLFDSFEGIQPPELIDGKVALEWAKDTQGPWYFNNLRVSMDDVKQAAEELGLAEQTELVKGWFEETLPANRDRVGPIALLRIDCDWYASVKVCLDELFDQVVDGGLVVFDDYFTYEGCSVAVHEFLGRHHLAYPIESSVSAKSGMPAVIRKGWPTWAETFDQLSWQWELRQFFQEHPADRSILVDQDSIRHELPAALRLMPFTERGGEYWGPPASDQTAIRDLQRLKGSGAELIVFAWPALWWLDYYSGFHDYLRTTFRTLHQSDRLVVFDLH